MALKKQSFDLMQARNELVSLIDNFLSLSKSEELRERVKALIPAFHILRKFGINIISKDAKMSARNRILVYLKKYPLIIIDSEELLVVYGITDYQRRIRELRVQFGWPILSGSTVKNMYFEGEWPLDDVNHSKMKPHEYI